MTMYAEVPDTGALIRRLREQSRDAGANSLQRRQDPVSQSALTDLAHVIHENAHVVDQGSPAQPADISTAISAGLPPKLKDGQAHNGASSGAPTRRDTGGKDSRGPARQ